MKVEAFAKAIEPTLETARNAARFLDDYALFLATFHDTAPPAAEVQKNMAVLKNFIQQFSGFEGAATEYRK